MTNLLFIFSEEDNFIIRSSGESLEELALHYGTPPAVIIALNHLESEPEINDILLMKRLRGSLYRVKPGDRLKNLSSYCHMSDEEFLNYNCIKSIYPFQIVELYVK